MSRLDLVINQTIDRDDYHARYLLCAQGLHPNVLQATWKYLLAYQVSQGQSFHDAVRLCQDERDVITVINPSLKQIAWLKQQTAANLDIIYAQDFTQLGQIMNKRLADNHRFGPPWSAGADELRLKWPVDDHAHLIIQAFGISPELYQQVPASSQPLHGHEGWDILAPAGSQIIAAAAGNVLRLDDDPDSWPYGQMVRLEHRLADGDTYQTVYAHLEKVTVKEGEQVEASQLIGYAGCSGHCNLMEEAYLHFHLQWIGATQRGYRDPWGRTWPRDLIWPGDKMIDAYQYQPGSEPPATSKPHQYAGPRWEHQRALVGVNTPAEGRLEPSNYAAFRTARVEAVRQSSTADPRDVDELRRQLDDPFILVQLVASFWQDDAPRVLTPADFVRQVEPRIEPTYQRGVCFYEVHHLPNIPQQGLGGAWANGAEYGAWWITVRDLLAPHFPNAKWGFPGLSSSAHLTGGKEIWSFLEHAQAAVQAADWVAVQIHWETEDERNDRIVNQLGEYRCRWPDKLLLITEFDNIAPEVSAKIKAQQYIEFYQIVQRIPGVAAAFHRTQGASQQWVQNGAPTKLAFRIGNRTF